MTFNGAKSPPLIAAIHRTIPRDKVRERLRDIAAQREKLSERMEAVAEDLGDGVTLIDECLKLLEDPRNSTNAAPMNNAALSARHCSSNSSSRKTPSPATT
ncbi:hypothetical protein GCM10023346_31180 [Arthrobacter gyeryongensis]|uniref:Uncharacterized protein n=1 Tax=Arthrobacter gyeryongensis TaxID=1650592 RepID=A0ABP9SKP4_9MICC